MLEQHTTGGKRDWTLLLVIALLGAALPGCTQSTRLIPFSRAQADIKFEKSTDPPPTPKALYAMARILGKQGKDTTCQLVLTRIIRQHRNFIPAYNELAQLYLRQGELDDAIQALLAGLHAAPEEPMLLNNLGMCWLLRKDYTGALDNFTKAASLAPHNERYRSNMAVALAMAGRNEEALALFMQVLSLEDANHNLEVLAHARGGPPGVLLKLQPDPGEGMLEAVGEHSE